LTGGVALHAINVHIVTTILPSVVSEIGGLEYYAWNITLFVAACGSAGVRHVGFGDFAGAGGGRHVQPGRQLALGFLEPVAAGGLADTAGAAAIAGR